jgi:hypothetical protein
MADEDRGAVVGLDRVVDVADVAGQRRGWMLGDRDLLTLGGERAVDALPARAVDKRAMNENDVGCVDHDCLRVAGE